MSDSRWQQVKEVFQEALDVEPPQWASYVRERCGDDDELRAEVETLLLAHRQAGSFAEHPATALLHPAGAQPLGPALTVGQSFGAYQIVGWLGSGGMGEVYRARDSKLGRDVAIKILPAALAIDSDRLVRFEPEARVLAALNHPHIGAIHSCEQVDGIQALVLELVEGSTLAERLLGGPLHVHEALVAAAQIAEALEAAHEKGIIHRDLKPANIKITSDGHVKVLDFGLAKWATGDGGGPDFSQASSLSPLSPTGAGVIIGSASSMSPEQARGKRLDARTDIWAFGCVLYEMLTGRPPFEGETFSDTIAAIIARDPNWAELPKGLPAGVRSLLQRCLEKEASARLGHIADARANLDTAIAEVKAPAARKSRVRSRRAGFVLAGIASALALAGAFVSLNSRHEQVQTPLLANPVQVTAAIGFETEASWSPDGRTLAYESNQSGNWDIWILELGSPQPVNRTADHQGSDRVPRWAPGGREILFRSDRDGGGYYVVSPFGGAVRRIARTATPTERTPAAWSSDGLIIARPVDSNGVQGVDLMSSRDEVTRHLSLPGNENSRYELSWSPDGKWLAYVVGTSTSQEGDLWILRLDDGGATPVTDGRANDWSPTWTPDARALYFVSDRDGGTDLWRAAISDQGIAGPAVRVTTGLQIRNAVLSPDGTRLAYTRGRRVANLWRMPILNNRPSTWADAQQLTFDQAFIQAWDLSPDGKTLVLSSDRTGRRRLWTVPATGGEMHLLTVGEVDSTFPRWSPDGERIVFNSAQAGSMDIWMMSGTGDAPRPLTSSPGSEFLPAWSPDGRQIVFTWNRRGDTDIWTLPAEGGEPRQLTDGSTNEGAAVFSPDGRWLYFVSSRSGQSRVYRMPAESGPAELVTHAQTVRVRFSTDGKLAVLTGFHNGDAGNVFALRDGQGTEQQLTDLKGRLGNLGNVIASDGRFLYYSWEEDLGDLWVADLKP